MGRDKLRSINLRKYRKIFYDISDDGQTMYVRYGVYFDETLDRQCGNTMFLHPPYDALIADWLEGNAVGLYSIQPSYIYFEEERDALMCHLAFS